MRVGENFIVYVFVAVVTLLEHRIILAVEKGLINILVRTDTERDVIR